MNNPPARQWPRKVVFRLCPNCGRHASFVIDGKEDKPPIISIEGAIHRVIQFVKQRRITYAQASALGPAIAAACLPALEADAVQTLFGSDAFVGAEVLVVGESVRRVWTSGAAGERAFGDGERGSGVHSH